MAGANLSYHKGLEWINRVLHRGQDTAIKFRTYRDFCERTGRKIEDQITQEMRGILDTHQFDAESGKPTESIAARLVEGERKAVWRKGSDGTGHRENQRRPPTRRGTGESHRMANRVSGTDLLYFY